MFITEFQKAPSLVEDEFVANHTMTLLDTRHVILVLQYLPPTDGGNLVCKSWYRASAVMRAFSMYLPDRHFTPEVEGLSLLSLGTFSSIYTCEIKKKRYAIKLIDKVTQARLQNIRRLRREIKVHQSCVHPNILKLHCVRQNSRSLFMVQEFAEKGDLFDIMNTMPQIEPKKAVIHSCCAQLTFCLDYMHTQGIIFRDLRLENILVVDDGSLKLSDFGNAKFLLKRQKTFTLCGVPEACAPEMLCNSGHSHPVDLWALGILLYELIMGHSPFYSENEMDTYARILSYNGKINLSKEMNTLFDDQRICKLIQTLLLLEKDIRGKFAESEEEKGPKHNDTTLMGLAQTFAGENTATLSKIPNKEVKKGQFIKDFPRSSKLKHRMAQLEWNRYCGCF